MAKRCPDCGRFMGDVCSHVIEAAERVVMPLYTMAMVTTIITNPEMPAIVKRMGDFFNNEIAKAQNGHAVIQSDDR